MMFNPDKMCFYLSTIDKITVQNINLKNNSFNFNGCS